MKSTKTNTKKSQAISLLIFACLYTIIQGVGIYLTAAVSGFHLRWVMSCALTSIMCFCMYFSYRSHTKNVMKPLVGAALMLLLAEEMNGGCDYLQDMSWGAFFGHDNGMAFFIIIQITILLVVAAINILHYVINLSHHSNPGLVRTNHILCVAFVALVAAQCVTFTMILDDITLKVGTCFATCSDIFMLACISRIEYSLDEFRIDRERKAEETGSPEGYNHEYEKK